MLKQLEKYYEQELRYAKVGIENEPNLKYKSDIAWHATQRCLGASQFVQMCGVAYEEVEPRYEAIRFQLREMVNRKMEQGE